MENNQINFDDLEEKLVTAIYDDNIIAAKEAIKAGATGILSAGGLVENLLETAAKNSPAIAQEMIAQKVPAVFAKNPYTGISALETIQDKGYNDLAQSMEQAGARIERLPGTIDFGNFQSNKFPLEKKQFSAGELSKDKAEYMLMEAVIFKDMETATLLVKAGATGSFINASGESALSMSNNNKIVNAAMKALLGDAPERSAPASIAAASASIGSRFCTSNPIVQVASIGAQAKEKSTEVNTSFGGTVFNNNFAKPPKEVQTFGHVDSISIDGDDIVINKKPVKPSNSPKMR